MAVKEQNNFVLGAGNIYFARLNDDGTYAGERHLGESPGFTIGVESTKVEFFGSGCGTANQKLASVTTQINRTATITCRDITYENLQLALAGSLETVAQAAGPVTGETFENVEQGLHYQLGATAANPVGVGEVSAVTVKSGAGTADEGDDYTVDLKRGRIYIVAGGGIDDGDDIEVDYTPTAGSYTTVASGDMTDARGRLRFTACNVKGTNKDVVLPLVSLSLSGDLAFKGEDFLEVSFEVEILKPAEAQAIYINGKAVA